MLKCVYMCVRVCVFLPFSHLPVLSHYYRGSDEATLKLMTPLLSRGLLGACLFHRGSDEATLKPQGQ